VDRYTLMASKLTQLQEEWKPKVGDKVLYQGEKYFITKITSGYIVLCPLNKGDEICVIKIKELLLIYKPSLEALIEMLEDEKNLALDRLYEEDTKTIIYSARIPGLWEHFDSNSFKEALIQLAAYERWGLTWDEKKETWV